MPNHSKIEWTETTWNPVTGCDHVSDGCRNCYAERLAHRLHAMGNRRYANGFQLQTHPDLFDAPLRWRRPRMIFVNSMSDLFHEQLPFDAIVALFETMNLAYWHTFQILTKRTGRLLQLSDRLSWTSNIWMGVTVESDRYTHRIAALSRVPSAVRFVSFEPLLSGIDSDTSLTDIDWAIVGGESGPGARPIHHEWVTGIRGLCERDDVDFFFKQWGGTNKKRTGRKLEGRTWDSMPQVVGAV
jgi:protein gp37